MSLAAGLLFSTLALPAGRVRADPGAAPAPQVVAPFLYAPYPGTATENSIFDHSSPNYTQTDNLILAFTGDSATRYCPEPPPPGEPPSQAGVCDAGGGIYWSYSLGDWMAYNGHDGIDYGVQYRPLYAAADSERVVYAGWQNPMDHRYSLGLYVRLRHPNGYSTYYGHMSAVAVQSCSSNCPSVPHGEMIGYSGSTGNSTGPHLHFAVFDPTARFVDPYGWAGQGEDPWPYNQRNSLWVQYPSVVSFYGSTRTVMPTGPALPYPAQPNSPVTVNDGGAGYSESPSGCLTVASTTASQSEGGSMRYVRPVIGGSATCTARWNFPTGQPAGLYAVYVRIPGVHASSEGAIYTIAHMGQTKVVTVNQQVFPNPYYVTNGWLYIGKYNFAAGGGEFISLPNLTQDTSSSYESRELAVDAVRFDYLSGIVPTNTPLPTSTPTITRTPTKSRTPTNSGTPTNSRTPTDTYTPSNTFTASYTRTNTGTSTWTATRWPTATRRPTDTRWPTWTRSPTGLERPTDTRWPTATRTATSGPSPTPTPSSGPTLTPSATNTSSETPTSTETLDPALAATLSVVPTRTPTASRTAWPTVTRRVTDTRWPSNTPRPTDTRWPTWTPRPSPTPSLTLTPSQTVTLDLRPTDTFAPGTTEPLAPTTTVTPTVSWTPTLTATRFATDTRWPSNTPRPTDTRWPTVTRRPTRTNTPSLGPSLVPTSSETPALTLPASGNSGETATGTPTSPAPALTATFASSPSPTFTRQPTATRWPTAALRRTDTRWPSPTIRFTDTRWPTKTRTPVEIMITVFFADLERVSGGTPPFETAVTRRVRAEPASQPLAILTQFFLGPTDEERAQGLDVVLSGFTGFSDFRLQDQVAYVYLTGACDSGGATYTIVDVLRVNLLQFPEIEWVKVFDQDGNTQSPDGQSDSAPACLQP